MKVNCKFYQGETFGCFFCEKHGRILPDFCGHCADKKAKSKYNNKKTVVKIIITIPVTLYELKISHKNIKNIAQKGLKKAKSIFTKVDLNEK